MLRTPTVPSKKCKLFEVVSDMTLSTAREYIRHLISTMVEKYYGERTSLFCVVHSRGGATGHKGARRRAAAMQC